MKQEKAQQIYTLMSEKEGLELSRNEMKNKFSVLPDTLDFGNGLRLYDKDVVEKMIMAGLAMYRYKIIEINRQIGKIK